jgi:hypothetical protein
MRKRVGRRSATEQKRAAGHVPTPAAGLPAGLAGDARALTAGNTGLLRHLQRTVGNAGVQHLLLPAAGPRAGAAVQRKQGGTATCTTPTADEWRQGLTDAQALSGARRAAAMTRLAQQAVCEIGLTVREAGTAHTSAVHPDDYAEVPVVNFDARLNDKTRWRGQGRVGPPVGTNVGYNFHAGSRRFAIIGPLALNPNTLLTTRQYAQHELYLVNLAQPAGTSADDLELQTWTEDFRNYFHQYLDLPLAQRPTWRPLLTYYDRTRAGPRTAAIRRLVDYFNNPSGGDADRVRRQMRSWMRRVSGTLTTDLAAALPAP